VLLVTRGGILTNNFNSLLKRRLKMINSKKSSGLNRLKFAGALSLILVHTIYIVTINISPKP
jgi:hypothetical protein